MIDLHDRHIAVGGTALVGAPLAVAGTPHLIWCASDMLGDRIDRIRSMAAPRRAYDRLIVRPMLSRIERRILAGCGRIATVSPYAASRIESVSPLSDRTISHLPIPVDLKRFHPPPSLPKSGVIGFSGRMSDPRKNIRLLLDAVARADGQGAGVTALLAGDATPALKQEVVRRGLEHVVRFVGTLPPDELPNFYQNLDVFVVPSRQEGLLISGLEAAACGVPIVSARCGGPECYGRDGETGFLTDFGAPEISARIVQISADRTLRARLSANARTTVESEFSHAAFADALDREWCAIWGEPVDKYRDDV